jgi:hypothetical protein
LKPVDILNNFCILFTQFSKLNLVKLQVLHQFFHRPDDPRLLRWAERHGATVSASWLVLQPVAGDGDPGDPGDRTCHATERLEEGMASNDGEMMFDGDILMVLVVLVG